MSASCSAHEGTTGRWWLGALILLLTTGCGGPSEDVPLPEVRKRAARMSTDELRGQAQAYREAYRERRQEMDKLRARIKSYSAGNPQASRLTALSRKATEISRSTDRLHERYEIYLEVLVRRGVDVEDLELD